MHKRNTRFLMLLCSSYFVNCFRFTKHVCMFARIRNTFCSFYFISHMSLKELKFDQGVLLKWAILVSTNRCILFGNYWEGTRKPFWSFLVHLLKVHTIRYLGFLILLFLFFQRITFISSPSRFLFTFFSLNLFLLRSIE